MKFLEIAELDILSRALNLSTPTLRVTTRIEAYSCKAISRERKLFKALETELIQDLSHSTSVSPPEQHQGLLDSAFGPLDKRASRKTLWLLIGLLNVAFPDHDFSKVRPEEFRKEEGPRGVLASLSLAVDHLRSPVSQRSVSSYPPSSSISFPSSPQLGSISLPTSSHMQNAEADAAIAAHPFLRQVLDPVIDLAECEVYTYTPDADSDPYAADSDDESEADGDSDAYERDDDGMAWEMDGIDGSGGTNFAQQGPSWQGGYGTPRKAFSSFLPPGTPTGSIAEPDDWSISPASTASLLCSSHHFLFNKKMKRILFISSSAHSRSRQSTYFARGLKRRASTSSVSSLVFQEHESKRSKP